MLQASTEMSSRSQVYFENFYIFSVNNICSCVKISFSFKYVKHNNCLYLNQRRSNLKVELPGADCICAVPHDGDQQWSCPMAVPRLYSVTIALWASLQ